MAGLLVSDTSIIIDLERGGILPALFRVSYEIAVPDLWCASRRWSRARMLNDIIEVEPRGDYRVWLRFQDGTEGEIDLGPHLKFRGIFATLRDTAYFAQVRLNPEIGTICWPNGADWDPLVLYSLITGRPIDALLDESRRART